MQFLIKRSMAKCDFLASLFAMADMFQAIPDAVKVRSRRNAYVLVQQNSTRAGSRLVVFGKKLVDGVFDPTSQQLL